LKKCTIVYENTHIEPKEIRIMKPGKELTTRLKYTDKRKE